MHTFIYIIVQCHCFSNHSHLRCKIIKFSCHCSKFQMMTHDSYFTDGENISFLQREKRNRVESIRVKLKFDKVIEDLAARDWKCVISRNAF